MLSISVEEFLIWKKKQLSKGGDQQSFSFLLDCVGGLSRSEINLKAINPNVYLYGEAWNERESEFSKLK